jgi:hypothetical protein
VALWLAHCLSSFAMVSFAASGERGPSSTLATHPSSRAASAKDSFQRGFTAWPVVPTGSLCLIENKGQWPAWLSYAGRLGGAVVRWEADGALGLELRDHAAVPEQGVLVRLSFEGSAGKLEPSEMWPTNFSWFLGNDPEHWVRAAKGYGRLRVVDLYPGIDLELSSREGRLKYDLHVAPGADPSSVCVRVEGLEGLRIADEGVWTAGGDGPLSLVHLPGLSWQVLPDGSHEELICAWSEESAGLLRLSVNGRDSGLPLVIDPELVWATYLGGNGSDGSNAIAGNPDHEVVIAGGTNSTNFPTTPGSFQMPVNPFGLSVTAIKMDRTGWPIYSCVFGGVEQGQQLSQSATLDNMGRATIVGYASTADFPTTPGSYDPIKNSHPLQSIGFVTRLAADGSDLDYSTFLEGDDGGGPIHSAVTDSQGRVIVAGAVAVPTFPTTPGTVQPSYGGGGADGHVTCLSADGSRLEWSTFLGGTKFDAAYALTLGPQNEVYVVGETESHDFPTTPGVLKETITAFSFHTGFVSKLSARGDQLEWATFLGGSTFQLDPDQPRSVALDAQGTVFVAGGTQSPDFPTTPGAFKTQYPPGAIVQGFLCRITPDATAFLWSTLTGGEFSGGAAFVKVDASGVPTLLGGMQEDYPLPRGSFDPTFNGGSSDPILLRMSPQGDRLFYGTYIGGGSHESNGGHVLSATGRVGVAGNVFSPGLYPTTPGSFQPNFNGGQTDGTAAALDLDLVGLEHLGDSVASCLGPIQIHGTQMPVAGSDGFAVWCSQAPPDAHGLLLLGTALTAPVQVGGLLLWINPFEPLVRIPVHTDGYGYVEVPLTLFSTPAGAQVSAQLIMRSTPSCLGAASWATSPALVITAQ